MEPRGDGGGSGSGGAAGARRDGVGSGGVVKEGGGGKERWRRLAGPAWTVRRELSVGTITHSAPSLSSAHGPTVACA